MKRCHQQRVLSFERLESKIVPSSILVVPGGDASAELRDISTTSVAIASTRADCYRYDTEQILRFIAENTISDEHAHRPGLLPTPAQCAAADEMMGRVMFRSNGMLVLGFYDGGIEL